MASLNTSGVDRTAMPRKDLSLLLIYALGTRYETTRLISACDIDLRGELS